MTSPDEWKNRKGELVTIPHTWNAQDGTDGDNTYFRGSCLYTKRFNSPLLQEGQELWVEFGAAAMSCSVWLNGKLLGSHENGFSAFRVNLTPALKKRNVLAVLVDNSVNDRIYPQKADFTFYGGLYRSVYLIQVESEHFDLAYHGSQGIKVTPVLDENLEDCHVCVEVWANTNTVDVTVGEYRSSLRLSGGYGRTEITMKHVRRWDGLKDPWLYTATAQISGKDEVSAKFGCRRFEFDAERGFFLNGRSYPLYGAARHQDREGVGNAISDAQQLEDFELMREMGINSVRLSHYQHDQYFYDLCDEYGMIVWAEIPYITQHLPEGNENTTEQLTDLIVQNYHHASVCCWGLSNEITAGGKCTGLVENHRRLNDLAHRLDPNRRTAMAHAFMLEADDELVGLTDICGYNLYYGWYLGSLEGNEKWFDELHKKRPELKAALTEFGADANPAYHSASPFRGDYSEEYQTIYHEHMLAMRESRPFIWGMFVWNMFDFGADGRREGGKPGQNQKGLVTFDRKIKKDAFFLYKAYLSDEPFVHLCGKRYVDRVGDQTEIKVYSNQENVTLYIDGKKYASRQGNRIFRFLITLSGEHCIRVTAGEAENLWDEGKIRQVSEPNPAYSGGGAVVNWFDKPEEMKKEGCFSIFDTVEEIISTREGAALWAQVMSEVRRGYGDVAKTAVMPDFVRKIQNEVPCAQILRQAKSTLSESRIRQINYQLNQIKKPGKEEKPDVGGN